MSFHIHGLAASYFAPLFNLADTELENLRITRSMADADQGFPCRVSLCEAPKDTELLLINYTHLSLASPYRASHAIYVAKPSLDVALVHAEIPQSLTLRPLSLRAFTPEGDLRVADLADQRNLPDLLSDMLSDNCVAFVHIHNAKQGCYAALATRTSEFDPAWRGRPAHHLCSSGM